LQIASLKKLSKVTTFFVDAIIASYEADRVHPAVGAVVCYILLPIARAVVHDFYGLAI
jgi:hypothetical protein